MFFIYSLIIVSTSGIHSSSTGVHRFSRIDCYESPSDPTQQMVFESNFPINPYYLRIKVHFELDPTDSETPKVDLHAEHHFVRVSKSCENSMEFTTKGIAFRQMRLNIHVYNGLDDSMEIADFSYKFDSLASNHYKLLDTYVRFGIPVNVLSSGDKHIKLSIHSEEDAIRHLESLRSNKHELCLITDNNEVIVVRPTYEGRHIPHGLITYVTVKYIKNHIIAESSRFPAFECPTDQELLPEEIIYFAEEPFSNTRYYSVHYTSFWGQPNEDHELFTIEGQEFIDFKRWRRHGRYNHKKLFLLNNDPIIEQCPNGTKRYVSKSASHVAYYAKELMFVEESSGVERKKWFSRDSSNPCGLKS